MATTLPPAFTARDAMLAASVNDTDLFNGQSSAEMLAEDVFDDDFLTCMDKSQVDVEDDLKSLSSLTVAQGKIQILPQVKNGLKRLFNGQGMKSGSEETRQ